MALTDATTVARLQSRAPAISKKDLAALEQGMRDGSLFPGVTVPDSRVEIWSNLQTIDFPIPTLQTFFRDIRFLAVPRDVMTSLYEPQFEVIDGVKVEIKVTVDQGVSKCFCGPEDPSGRNKLRYGLQELWRFSM